MGRFVMGREATFTISGTNPEATAPVTTKFNRVRFRITRKRFPTTPPGYLLTRTTYGILACEGFIGNWYDSTDGTPPIPGGVAAPSANVGIITILLTTGKSIAFPATLYALDHDISLAEGGAPNQYQYAFEANAQSTSDTITVVGG